MTPASPLARRTLMGLPLAAWAAKLRRGTVALDGRCEALDLRLGGWGLHIDGGPLSIDADFAGGRRACLERAAVRAPMTLRSGDKTISGTDLVLEGGRIWLDSVEVPVRAGAVGSGRMLARLVRQVADVSVFARAEPDGDVFLELGHGIEVRLTRGVLLTVRGAASGPPDELQLEQPLEIGFGGDGIRLSHDQMRWLSRLAEVRIARATLHPDGKVALHGRGSRGFDRAVRGSLSTASASLSTLVRRSPGFRRVRQFLKPGGS